MRWCPALAALCCAMMLCSCEADLRDLCYDHSHATNLNVAFDWQMAPEMQPSGMTVLFYKVEQVTGEPERYDFAGHEGARQDLSTTVIARWLTTMIRRRYAIRGWTIPICWRRTPVCPVWRRVLRWRRLHVVSVCRGQQARRRSLSFWNLTRCVG